MAWLAAAAPYIGLILAGTQAYQQRKQGEVAESNAELAAIRGEREANAAQAEAQREASNELRKAKLLKSRATALAAASGAGASDPTIENILGKLDAEGEYRALSALYSGDTDAELARAQAGVVRKEGKARRRSANLSSATTLLGGASNFYSKYGS